MNRWLRLPLRLLESLLGWLLALLILFEEWGWEPLQRLMAAIGRRPGLRWIEGAIRRLPPYGALALFALPTLMLVPVKLGALWLIGQGHVVSGAVVIIVAKLVGTAVVTRGTCAQAPGAPALAGLVGGSPPGLTGWNGVIPGWCCARDRPHNRLLIVPKQECPS